MTVEHSIVQFLMAETKVADLVGNRVFPVKLPDQTELPAITYARISSVRQRSHSGKSNLTGSRYQFSIWAKTQRACAEVRDAFIEKIDCAQTGDILAFHENDNEMYSPAVDAYHMPVDVMINH